MLLAHGNCTNRTRKCTRAILLSAELVDAVVQCRSILIGDSFGMFPPSGGAGLDSSKYLDESSYDVA
jgi:hypothetical protein